MARKDVLTQLECFKALKKGYILQNEHGFTTYLHKGVQRINNYKRLSVRGKNYPYKFDYPTWRICGRISLKERLINMFYRFKRSFL